MRLPHPFPLTAALRDQLLRRAQNLCRGRFDAEDLVQEVLAANLEPAPAYEARLFVSLKHAFISRLRRARTAGRAWQGLAKEEPSTPAPGDQPEPALWELVTGDDLRQAVASLSRKQLEVFEAVTAGERYADIAARLHISATAVGKRAFDARQRLKERLLKRLARRRS